MSDVECPYCGADEEINHDDGYGYGEDQVYEQQCGTCDMTYSYTTSFIVNHEASKAPCLNGGEHIWKGFHRFSNHGREEWKRCMHCEEERRVDG